MWPLLYKRAKLDLRSTKKLNYQMVHAQDPSQESKGSICILPTVREFKNNWNKKLPSCDGNWNLKINTYWAICQLLVFWVVRYSLSRLKSDILVTQSPKSLWQKGLQNQFSFVYMIAKCQYFGNSVIKMSMTKGITKLVLFCVHDCQMSIFW